MAAISPLFGGGPFKETTPTSHDGLLLCVFVCVLYVWVDRASQKAVFTTFTKDTMMTNQMELLDLMQRFTLFWVKYIIGRRWEVGTPVG